MADCFLPLFLLRTNVSRVSGGILVARGVVPQLRENPGLGIRHEKPSASEFSELRLSIFRTDGAKSRNRNWYYL